MLEVLLAFLCMRNNEINFDLLLDNLHLVTYYSKGRKGVFALVRIGVVLRGSFKTRLRSSTHQEVMSHQQ